MNDKKLADYLRSIGIVKSERIYKAFVEVDRADFVPEEEKPYVLEDHPLPIGWGQTNSQPYTVAFMLELLEPAAGQKILDVGSGSGWTTALLAQLVGPKGRVDGVEAVPSLVSFGSDNLNKYPFKNATITKAEPGVLGLPNQAPFDRILVSAAATHISKDLIAQLSAPGIMIEPVASSIYKIFKDHNGRVETEEYPGFAFVPLVGS